MREEKFLLRLKPLFLGKCSQFVELHLIIETDMEIKVLGTGCAGCRTLYETVTQAIAELGISAAIVKEEDIAEILSYGIMTLPGLVVDGRVVSAGRKLSLAEVKELLNR